MTLSDMTNKPMNRRAFLRISGLALTAVGAILAGCSPSRTGETALQSGDQGSTPATVTTATPVLQPSVATSTAVPTSTPGVPNATPTRGAVATATQAAPQAFGVACPRGLLNDPFPGRCRAYVDRNGNGYCDLSELGSGKITPGSEPSVNLPRR